MTAQSWVETTLPPGYSAHVIRPGVHEFFFGHAGNRWGYTSHAETCRAAWRHWTAAVLRGRGDVRAEDYGASGGVAWHLRSGQPWPSCWAGGALMSLMPKGGGYCISSYDHESGEVTCRYSDDIDEAMARFAMLVMYDQGPR